VRTLQLSKFYPPVMGGIESVVFELTEGMNRLQQRADVLCANLRLKNETEQWPHGYSVTRAASFGRLLSTSMAPAMIRLLARQAAAYDLIHLHLPDPMANLALWLTRPRAKVVIHWHSDIIQQKRALAAYQPLQRWLLERADAIVATSDAYWRASPWLPRFAEKIHPIPIGIQDRHSSTDPRRVAELRARFGGRRIVFALGRMVHYKGFDHLVAAAPALPDDTVVVIGGSGPMLPQLRASVAAKGLAHKVFLTGRISSEDIDAYFDAADLFCLPSDSRAEAFGVVLLEAMRAGKPIIASDIPGSGVPWVNVHGTTGLNVPVGDVGALGTAISTVLGNRELARQYGLNARQRYLELFTADKMVDACLRLYARLVPEAGYSFSDLNQTA
jgi:glycosyltransferase involved in cell wall biosynthesis